MVSVLRGRRKRRGRCAYDHDGRHELFALLEDIENGLLARDLLADDRD